MPRLMLTVLLTISITIFLTVFARAADKVDFPAQIAAAKASIDDIAAKVGNYPQALVEIERARGAWKKAEHAYDKGRQWMGLGGLKPEAEQEVRHHLQMVEMATTLATSRAAKGRIDEDTALIDKQLAVVKARVKLLEDRKAEEERLRQTAQKYEAAANELAALKTDNAKRSAQIDQLISDKKKLESQLEAVNAEKAALTSQLETLKKSAAPTTAPVSPTTSPALQTPIPAPKQ